MIFPLVTVDDVLWPQDSTATLIASSTLPAPYRGLLAHQHHMTVTVEDFYASKVNVRVLASGVVEGFYHRKIVLALQSTDRIVQYGLVRINLDVCCPSVRHAIVEEKTPLGRILIENNVLLTIEPTAFLRVQPGPTLANELDLKGTPELFGRTGVIFFHDHPAIAVLEILAPVV